MDEDDNVLHCVSTSEERSEWEHAAHILTHLQSLMSTVPTGNDDETASITLWDCTDFCQQRTLPRLQQKLAMWGVRSRVYLIPLPSLVSFIIKDPDLRAELCSYARLDAHDIHTHSNYRTVAYKNQEIASALFSSVMGVSPDRVG